MVVTGKKDDSVQPLYFEDLDDVLAPTQRTSNPRSSTRPSTRPPTVPPPDPGAPLISVLPKGTVIKLAVVAFVAALLLILWPLIEKARFDGQFARTVLAIGFSLVAGIFLFVLYPWNFRLTKIPLIDLSVELAGPIVLFIGLTLFIREIVPNPEGGRVHRLSQENGSPLIISDLSRVEIGFPDEQTEPAYHLVLAPDRRTLHAIYVVYPEGKTKLQVTVKLSKHYKKEVRTLKRYDTQPTTLALPREENE
jgi:hypothetical protein